MFIFLKALCLWLIMVLLAIVNGFFRDSVLTSRIGEKRSLPLSGVLLSVSILLIVFISIPIFGNLSGLTYLLIGVLWFSLTLTFETVFVRLVRRQSWAELFQVFNLKEGNLFLLILVVTLFSPYLIAYLRGFI
jgi:hypothetical protein